MTGPGHHDSDGGATRSTRAWQPRTIHIGEAEIELVWWGAVQLAVAVLLSVVAVIAVLMIVLQSVSGEMPWQAAVVVAGVPIAALIGAGWMFRHREVRLRLDSAGISHQNRLGGFNVAWSDVRRVELISGRGSPVVQVTTAVELDHTGRRRREIVVEDVSVPTIAEAVEHWTGRPLLVRAAGTTVAWSPDDGQDAAVEGWPPPERPPQSALPPPPEPAPPARPEPAPPETEEGPTR